MRERPWAWQRRRLVVTSLGAALVALLLPVAALAQSLEELERELGEVDEQRDDVEQRLQDTTEAFDELESRIGELEQERDDLRRRRDALRTELEELDELVTLRVRSAFKHGVNLDPLAVFLGSDDPTAALSRAETVQHVLQADRVSAEELAAVRTRATAAEERLSERTDQLDEARAELDELGSTLQEDLERLGERQRSLTQAQREERARIERARQERREREERERREREQRQQRQQEQGRAAASSPSGGGSSGTAATSGGLACPLDQPRSFVDSWGAPRSGGRAHRGTDIMGPHGIPVRAIVDGVWTHQRVGASAGVWGILRGDNGEDYWYLHLTSHTVGSGARVQAGQQIATNGATGNAPPNAPHVHFEQHPGGGSAINPYPLLRRACG